MSVPTIDGEVFAGNSAEFVFVLLGVDGRPESLVGWTITGRVTSTTADPAIDESYTGEIQTDPRSALVTVPRGVLTAADDYSVEITGTKGTREHTVAGTLRVLPRVK